MIQVTWHASVQRHPARAAEEEEDVSIVARKVITKPNAPMNVFPVRSVELVAFAKSKGIPRVTALQSQPRNVTTAMRKVSSEAWSQCMMQ